MSVFDVVIGQNNTSFSYVVVCSSAQVAMERAMDAHSILISSDLRTEDVTRVVKREDVIYVAPPPLVVDDDVLNSNTLPGWEWAAERGFSVAAWRSVLPLIAEVYCSSADVSVRDVEDLMDTGSMPDSIYEFLSNEWDKRLGT